MKKILVRIITLLGLVFIAGGFVALFQALDILWEVVVGFFPIFEPLLKQSLKNYLTSGYFIVGVIITISSSIGIVFSVKEKKILYSIVCLILDAVSLLSIINNIVACIN